ncbi:carboxylate-amine ligase [Dictyobacter arantiisoli]|uniref:Putative glutamate--cysteine ligase 2 n=1 Tax=Dictyobacter arantiisoli TaxID=2014874 RepID=A0A5A5T589_9CHLR|nr:carboxylate-amine ligase [Dictyobacter arantiisoli]GCF06457.1 putative glutamate--cysteine ligase 2 [Dictyobacter arantiisoli]
MSSRFTLGVEEEFQMVDRDTGQLVSHVHTVLDKGSAVFGELIKAEMLQSMVEIITGVCADIHALRQDLSTKRMQLATILANEGLAMISSGTHPVAHWRDQRRTVNERYKEIEEEFQDVGRSILICGLHVHVGIDTHEIAIPLMNQLRTWIPHLLALSSNSPFWINYNTGLKSYRSIVWKRFPRSGIPPTFTSSMEFDCYVSDLMRNNCIDNAKKIWWDIRPHPFFDTLEFRVCDMPVTFEDTMAIAALCQALVCKLTFLLEQNMNTLVLPTHYIEENKWKAARYGLDAVIVDFPHHRSLTLRDSLHETLDFVEDVVDELGIRREMNYLRILLTSSQGTGADQQIAVYNETQNIQAVIRYLMECTMQSIQTNSVISTAGKPTTKL